jgi:hypothetical protein
MLDFLSIFDSLRIILQMPQCYNTLIIIYDIVEEQVQSLLVDDGRDIIMRICREGLKQKVLQK